jgi:GT2 family glycosyltransferase
MSLSAIVPIWNGRDFLARLLDTLAAQAAPADELIAVDNGSTDGAPELAAARGARIIPMGRNTGFAAAVNRGIREARAEQVAILNSDVELAPDYFATLLACDAPFATGKILRKSDDRIDATFDLLCRGGCAWRAGHGRSDHPIFTKPRAITSPPWTAVLFRTEVFRRAGYLNESFESYLEDVEFGLRCAALGIRGCFEPRAVAWHHGSASLGEWHPETVRRISRNQVFLSRNSALWPAMVAQLLWGGLALLHGHPFAWLRGKLEAFRTRSASLPAPDDDALLHELQRVLGYDTYWRLYFLLTGGGRR